MSKTIVLICLICAILTGFSMPVIERDDFNLSMDFYGVTSVNYDLLADAGNYDTLMAFDVRKSQLSINGMYKNIEYVFNTSFNYILGENEHWVKDLYVNYHISDRFSVKIGYFNAPFGRHGCADDSELLMNKRNPLYEYYAPGRKIGIAPEIEMFDDKLSVSVGAYNGDDFENINEDKYFDYSGVVHFMPAGKFDYSESAHEGFEDLIIDISSGFKVGKDNIDAEYYSMLEHMFYDISFSWRYKTFALDVAYYKGIYDLEGFGTRHLNANSIQVAYAFNGKFEPSIRYTSVNFFNYYFEYDECFILRYKQRTSEYGFTWYLNDNSKLGFVYTYTDLIDDNSWYDPGKTIPKKNEVRLFFALDI